MFNGSADALVLWNSRCQRVDVNPAYERMFGFTRDEILFGALRELPADNEERRQELLARTLAGERCLEELETVRRSGERFPVEVRTIPIQHRGEPHVLVTIRDLTERRHVERDRARLEAQLRQAQKMEAIGHLTGGIAHDFNNLLTTIVGYVTLAAERSAGGDAKLTAYLDQAGLSCGRARDLIQQMLTFSRGRRGEPRPLALAPLVRESVKLLRSSFPSTKPEHRSRRRRAARAPRPGPARAGTDEPRDQRSRRGAHSTGQVGIAVRHAHAVSAVCASCRASVRVTWSSSPSRTMEAGSFRMSGAHVRAFLFDEDVGKGSGMGLATVHGIVHEHRGHIVVESAAGRGVFRVLLPALPADGASPPLPARGAQCLPRAALAGRVAVVDDEMSVTCSGRSARPVGSDATTFANGREMLDALVTGHGFDLVITDQTMPAMTGLELARELHGSRQGCPSSCIRVTRPG
jgi:PAS domain S-box-containing protein